MKNFKKNARNHQLGLSLLEIMVVLAIISLVVGLGAPRVMENFGRAKSQAVKIQLADLKGALQLFYLDVGRYPTESEGLDALLEKPESANGWNGPYADEATLEDPWQRRFIYNSPGDTKPFDLFSLGRDGYPGGSKEDTDIYL